MSNTNSNQTTLSKAILITVFILNIAFLVYWCILAFYSHLHYDDLHFLWKLREMSIFDYVKGMYYQRSGRFVAYFINGIMASVTNATGVYQFWAIFYYILGISICYLVAKEIDLPLSKTEKFGGICLFYNLYVLTNIDFPIFFWLCAMTYYLSFPIACLAFVYLNKSSLNWKEWVVLVLSAIFLGGGNEAFTPVFLVVLFLCGLYWWHSQVWDIKRTWALPQIKRIVWITVLIIVLFAIVVIAPGNYERMRDTTLFVHPTGLKGWIKAVSSSMLLFCYHMSFYLPYLFVLFILSYCIGTRLSIKLPRNKLICLLCILFGFFVYLFISCLPNVYLYGGFGIQRTYTHVVCALILAICLSGLVSGYGKAGVFPKYLSLIGSFILTTIMCFNVLQDTQTARDYSLAVDKRIEHLRSLEEKGQKETVKVPALPMPYTEDVKHLILSHIGKDSSRPSLYYVSDADVVPNEYEYHMKKVLGLGFDFILEE